MTTKLDLDTVNLATAISAGDEAALEELRRRWFEALVWETCKRCGLNAPKERLKDHSCSRQAVTPAPSFGVVTPMVASRPRKEPLYDSVTLRPGMDRATFFTHPEGKVIWETNCYLRGSLPAGQHFYWYGMSLLPDAGAHPEDVAAVRDKAAISLHFSNSRLLTHPSRTVIVDQPTVVDQDGEEKDLVTRWQAKDLLGESLRLSNLRQKGPAADITIAGKPLEFRAQEAFEFRLDIDPDAVKRPTSVMLVLYGLLLRAITG